LPERRGPTLSLQIVLRIQHQHAHAPHALARLRLGGERRGEKGAKERPPVHHSIT